MPEQYKHTKNTHSAIWRRMYKFAARDICREARPRSLCYLTCSLHGVDQLQSAPRPPAQTKTTPMYPICLVTPRCRRICSGFTHTADTIDIQQDISKDERVAGRRGLRNYIMARPQYQTHTKKIDCSKSCQSPGLTWQNKFEAPANKRVAFGPRCALCLFCVSRDELRQGVHGFPYECGYIGVTNFSFRFAFVLHFAPNSVTRSYMVFRECFFAESIFQCFGPRRRQVAC